MPATTDTGMSTLTKALWALATITFVATIVLFFRTGDAISQSSLAVSTAQDANTRAGVAKNMVKAVALKGDLPEPEDEYERDNMDPQERAVRDLMKKQKQLAEAERLEIQRLTSAVVAHEGALATVSEGIRANTQAIAATSNRLSAALSETMAQITTATDNKIRLALNGTATRADLDTLQSNQQDTSLMLATLSERVSSISNRMSGVKLPKTPKVRDTNTAVMAGSIVTNKATVVTGYIMRIGHPTVKKHWYSSRKQVNVTYTVVISTPNNGSTGLDEAVFQKFENSRDSLMADLATLSTKDDKQVAKFDRELTKEFGTFLEKEKILPQGAKFVAATAFGSIPRQTKTP